MCIPNFPLWWRKTSAKPLSLCLLIYCLRHLNTTCHGYFFLNVWPYNGISKVDHTDTMHVGALTYCLYILPPHTGQRVSCRKNGMHHLMLKYNWHFIRQQTSFVNGSCDVWLSLQPNYTAPLLNCTLYEFVVCFWLCVPYYANQPYSDGWNNP